MKKTVGIVTLNHGVNYGNKLQNYAVQRVYESLGYDPITIRFYPEGAKVKNTKWTIGTIIKKLNRKISNEIYKKNIKGRLESFNAFNTNYLKLTEKCYTPFDYKTIDDTDFDYFSVGSDQVWNSYFFDFCPLYLLDFVKDNNKKIAFAASFGVDDVSQKYEGQFAKYLSEFKAISVREDRAVQIVESISTNSAEVILDPTLMIPREDWEEFSDIVVDKKNFEFVFTYFLGDINNERKKIIYNFAKHNGFEVVEFNKINNKYYACDPREFVYYIKNAKMIFTDSFHACCFSLQFEKQFWVMNRISTGKEMGSRIDTFLSKFHLENRRYNSINNLSEDINYYESLRILEKEREYSWNFVRKALEK